MDFADALREHAERRLNGETARFAEHADDDDSALDEHETDDDSMAVEDAVGDGGGMVMHAIDDDDERAEAGSEHAEQETPVVEPVDEIDAEATDDDDDTAPLPGGIGIETALVLAITFGLATGFVGGELLRSLSTPSSGSDETDTDDGGGAENQNRGSGSVVGLS